MSGIVNISECLCSTCFTCWRLCRSLPSLSIMARNAGLQTAAFGARLRNLAPDPCNVATTAEGNTHQRARNIEILTSGCLCPLPHSGPCMTSWHGCQSLPARHPFHALTETPPASDALQSAASFVGRGPHKMPERLYGHRAETGNCCRQLAPTSGTPPSCRRSRRRFPAAT